MRVFGLFLLIGTMLAAGCESDHAPADAPVGLEAPRHRVPEGYRPVYPNWPATVLEIPAGLPGEGVDPRSAWYEKQTDIWVIGAGTVTRLLRDDTKPPRHQRFVVDLSGTTVAIAHNIDVAPRVPIKRGDKVAFRGEYIWNDQGGIVHWTHRDKRDKKAGGWIIWKGQNFR